MSGVVHQRTQSVNPRTDDDDGQHIYQRIPPGFADPDGGGDQAELQHRGGSKFDAVDLREVANFFFGEKARNIPHAAIAQFR